MHSATPPTVRSELIGVWLKRKNNSLRNKLINAIVCIEYFCVWRRQLKDNRHKTELKQHFRYTKVTNHHTHLPNDNFAHSRIRNIFDNSVVDVRLEFCDVIDDVKVLGRGLSFEFSAKIGVIGQIFEVFGWGEVGVALYGTVQYLNNDVGSCRNRRFENKHFSSLCNNPLQDKLCYSIDLIVQCFEFKERKLFIN